jgi:hypothetical protein
VAGGVRCQCVWRVQEGRIGKGIEESMRVLCRGKRVVVRCVVTSRRRASRE